MENTLIFTVTVIENQHSLTIDEIVKALDGFELEADYLDEEQQTDIPFKVKLDVASQQDIIEAL